MKAPFFHPAERLDLNDMLHATSEFPRDVTRLNNKSLLLDRRPRVLRGFRIEVPDQGTYKGRIVVHNGIGINRDGQILHNEEVLTTSRTVTLEVASKAYYIEIEFVEQEASADSRAFWDPTVDQLTDPSGDQRPDGQEFSQNVSTRKVWDWKVVSPITTSATTVYT